MRTLIRISMDTEKSNATIKAGGFPELLRVAIARLQPEATYFYAEHGKRTALFVADLKESSEIPAIAEPFFMEAGATVELFPTMNVEELQRGLAEAAKGFAPVPA